MLKKNLKHQNSNPFLPTLKGVKRSKETSPKHSPREEIPSTPRLNKSPRLSDDEEKDSLHDQISRYIGTVPTTKEKYLSEIEELNNLFHMAEKLYNVSNVFYIYGLPETCDDEKIANNIFSLKLPLNGKNCMMSLLNTLIHVHVLHWCRVHILSIDSKKSLALTF